MPAWHRPAARGAFSGRSGYPASIVAPSPAAAVCPRRELTDALAAGADRARPRAEATLARAKEATGIG